MRAVSLHPDVLVATSASADQLRDRRHERSCAGDRRGPRAASDEAFVIDSPVLPEELELLPALVEQAGFPAPQRPARHARRLGPPARAPRLPRRGARLRREHRRAPARRAGRGAARAARFDEELLHRAPAPAVARLGAGARRARALRDRRRRARAAPGRPATPPTGWPSGSAGRACSSPATTCRRSSSRRSATGGGRSMPTWRRSSACAPLVAEAEHVVPGHGPVLDGARRCVLEEDRRLPDRPARARRGGRAAAAAAHEGPARAHAQNVARCV